MHTTLKSDQPSFSQTVKSHLKTVMTVAKRRGAWFALSRREKSILYLSLKLDVKFASLDLLRALISAVKKLEQNGETLHAWLQRGTKLAWAFSGFAVSCGNEAAKLWRNDLGYALYLGRVLPATRGGASPA